MGGWLATLKIRTRENMHIPMELVEIILLDFPVKTLIRFSSVSKSWNSMILGPEFARRYRGREMMVLCSDYGAMACPVSSMLSDNLVDKATPFNLANIQCRASCGVLWCVEFEEKSLGLFNPSTRAYRGIPDPPLLPPVGSSFVDKYGSSQSMFVFGVGMGYNESGAKDYKVLRIHKDLYSKIEVFSAKSGCWRVVESRLHLLPKITFVSEKSLCLNGAVHWLVNLNRSLRCILTFNLSKEKCNFVYLPEELDFYHEPQLDTLDVSVLMGKLCVYSIKWYCYEMIVWVMESNSWRKEFDLRVDHGITREMQYTYFHLMPLYFEDTSGNLIKAITGYNELFVYKDGDGNEHSTFTPKNLSIKGYRILRTSSTYVESFVSPFSPSSW